jgi:spore coat polysaccharide biosynthesis protein SpsF (cytidylyltransferase family)
MTRMGAIIQARLDSTRLCHKVFKPLGGKTVLSRIISAAQAARLVDEVCVTTPDPAIADLAESYGACAQLWTQHRDVLAEYYMAARDGDYDPVIRLTADCPMLTGEVIDKAIRDFRELRVDGFYNGRDGQDVEVFTFDALDRAYRYATAPEEREHVGLWIKRNLLHRELPPRPGPWKSLDKAEDYAYICQWFDNQVTSTIHRRE